jgi:Cu(I)/Ag(I) efflux system membrane fusion protein
VVLNNKEDVKPGLFVEGKIKGISSSKEQIISNTILYYLWTGKSNSA